MKKILMSLVVLFLVGILLACNGAYTPQVDLLQVDIETTEGDCYLLMWPVQEEEPINEKDKYVSLPNIQIQYMTDMMLSEFRNYHEFIESDEAESNRIIITTDTLIFNFMFVALDYYKTDRGSGEVSIFEHATVLYSAEKLDSETAFITNLTVNPELSLHRGIVFMDNNSYHHFFSILQDYESGIYLSEIENRRLRSPRTAISGILGESEYSWETITVTAWRDPETREKLAEGEGVSYVLRNEDAEKVFELLSTMDAVEILTPFHHERRASSSLLTIATTFVNGDVQIIHTNEDGRSFFRFTNTYGACGCPGYVFGSRDGGGCENLFMILVAYF